MALTSFEETLRTYTMAILAENYPDIRVEAGSQLADLYVNPLVDTLKPLITLVNRLSFLQDLSNAEYMTVEELDGIGVNNYGVTRNPGTYAGGLIYVTMAPAFVGTSVVDIGPLTVANSDDYEYGSSTHTLVKYNSTDSIAVAGTILPGVAADYLEASTGLYVFPIQVTAKEPGAAYNSEINTVTKLVTEYPLLGKTVRHPSAFTNGNDQETNASYAARISGSIIAKQIQSSPGYRQYIVDNFKGVYDVLVQGYKDTLMTRDRGIVRENGAFVYKAIGGKVDLYVKGSNYQAVTQSSYVYSDKIRLSHPRVTAESSIRVTNYTTGATGVYTYNLNYENNTVKTGWLDLQVLTNSDGHTPADGDEIHVKYRAYLDDAKLESMWFEDVFYYNSVKVRLLNTPYSAVESITENVIGTLPAQTGTTSSTVLLPATLCTTDDYYNDLEINIVVNGSFESFIITDYVGSTQLATLNGYLSATPATDAAFIIKALPVSLTNTYTIEQDKPVIERGVIVDQGSSALTEFILDPDYAVPSEDFYIGNILYVTYNNSTVAYREITDYTASTRKCTLETALPAAPDVGMTYLIKDTTDPYIRSSFDRVNMILVPDSPEYFRTGDIINITYVHNILIRDIQYDFDVEENRTVTTDILIKEANPVYIYLGLNVKPVDGVTMTSANKLILQMLINDILVGINFGSSLEISDIVGLLYKQLDFTGLVNYIKFPVPFFSSTTPISDLTEATLLAYTDADHCKTIINFTGCDHPVLGMLAIGTVV